MAAFDAWLDCLMSNVACLEYARFQSDQHPLNIMDTTRNNARTLKHVLAEDVGRMVLIFSCLTPRSRALYRVKRKI